MIVSHAPQGTNEWLEARRGLITGSRFKDCRDRLKNGSPSEKMLGYAMDVARERCGGKPEPVFVNSAMRTGTEQEAFARRAYELRYGVMCEEAGFISDDERVFGASVDSFVEDDGILEVKTLVSSKTLFKAVVGGDISEYIDQCNGAMWLFGRKWVDLCLWAPDLPGEKLFVRRIERDDNVIEALEGDLMAFKRLVDEYETALRKLIGQPKAAPQKADDAPPWDVAKPAAIPETIF